MNKVFQSNDFKNRIVYQIYPASFMDSNNDGNEPYESKQAP